MPKEEKKEVKEEEWTVNLAIISEEKPPQKLLVKGEEKLDEWGYRAKVLNSLEALMKLLD